MFLLYLWDIFSVGDEWQWCALTISSTYNNIDNVHMVRIRTHCGQSHFVNKIMHMDESEIKCSPRRHLLSIITHISNHFKHPYLWHAISFVFRASNRTAFAIHFFIRFLFNYFHFFFFYCQPIEISMEMVFLCGTNRFFTRSQMPRPLDRIFPFIYYIYIYISMFVCHHCKQGDNNYA